MRDKAGVRWGRVLAAGVLTEAAVVLLIAAAVAGYKYGLSPTQAEHQAFSGRAGFYVGVFGGAPAAFALALWACRPLRAGFLKHGFLVGCVAALLHAALAAGAGAGFQAAYVLADALKLAGGASGGYVAAKRRGREADGESGVRS